MGEYEAAEAEDIVRAIREGEVDAFVVREAAEERIYSLRSADVLYRAMIEEMKDGAVALDASGLIIYCNAHFAQLVKAERPTVIGSRIASYLSDPDGGAFEDLVARAPGGRNRPELALRATDGKTVPVLAVMNAIRLGDGDVYCLIVTDLTEQKSREQLVQEGRRKDEFLAMLAHELRNPLAPIRYAAERLRMADATPERLEWARDVIGRQIEQLTRLVDDLLDVSRIARGKISLELQPVDVSTIVSRAIESVRPLIEARKQELRVTHGGARLTVRGDATRLAQVISNLLHNAAKFTAERGHIGIAIEREGTASGAGDRWVRITVSDDGVGIPSALLPEMFSLFAQAETVPGRSQGLGIGLTLVRSFVEMHGGTVTGASDGPGRGSRFTIRLPLLALPEQRRRPAPKAADLSVPAGVTSRRVFVVEDNPDVAETLELWLRDEGHDVRVARTAEAALREAPAFRPDVMLVDIGLPDMSGQEAARKLRSMPETKGSVLVAVTGFGQAGDRRRSEAAGFDHHWVKPISVEALSGLLDSLGPPARPARKTPPPRTGPRRRA